MTNPNGSSKVALEESLTTEERRQRLEDFAVTTNAGFICFEQKKSQWEEFFNECIEAVTKKWGVEWTTDSLERLLGKEKSDLWRDAINDAEKGDSPS